MTFRKGKTKRSDLHFEVHIVEVLVDGVFCRVVLDEKLAVFVDFKCFLKI